MSGFLRPEFLILVVIALLIFGPKKLPEMGSSIGKTIREFQRSMREVKEPEQPNAAVPPAVATTTPTAQITAPAASTAGETPAATAATASAAMPATPASTTPTADPLPPVGTTVE
ncbi:MAG TPA: twin-arginine translocase TatA/TatE family subunit [Ktedonobacterales bacterium]|nr:twin-arginine translocase TatA/TatE family subunit [Ktedonobacterales bacterium]